MGKTVVPVISLVVFLAVCGGIGWYVQNSSTFEIVTLGIRGHARLSPQSIVEHLNIPPHTNIFRVRLHDLQQQLESMTWVKKAEIFRNFPNKLSIHLIERTPFALIKRDELRLIDQDGVILGSLASGSVIRLPIITGTFIEEVELEDGSPQLQQALYAINSLTHSSCPLLRHVRKIRIDCLENVTFFSADSPLEVRLSLLDYQQSLQRLNTIYSELQLETLAAIDLRFEKRVIITPKNI